MNPLVESLFVQNNENIFISNAKYKKVVTTNQQKAIDAGITNFAITLGDARRSLDTASSVVASYNTQLGHVLRCALMIDKSLVNETPIQSNFQTRGPNPITVSLCVGFLAVPQALFDGSSTAKLEVGKHIFVINQPNPLFNGPYTVANINNISGAVDIVRYPYNSIITSPLPTFTGNYWAYGQEMSRQTAYIIESGPKFGGTVFLRSSESTKTFPDVEEFTLSRNLYTEVSVGYATKTVNNVLYTNSSGVKIPSDSSFSVGYITYDINIDNLFTANIPYTPLDIALTNSGAYNAVEGEVTMFVFPGVDWNYKQIKRFRNFSTKVGIVILFQNATNANFPTFETGFVVYHDNKYFNGFVLKKAVFSAGDNKTYPSTAILQRSGASNKIQVVACTTGLVDGTTSVNIQMIDQIPNQ